MVCSVISEVCDDPTVPTYMLHICGITWMPGQEAVAFYCYFCMKEAVFSIANQYAHNAFLYNAGSFIIFFSLKPVLFEHYKYEDVLISSDFTIALVTSSSKL